MTTIQDIKDRVQRKFNPFPLVDDNSIDDAIKDAIDEYNDLSGTIQTFDENHSDPIDLSSSLATGEELRTVVDIIPGQKWIRRSAGSRPAFVSLFSELGIGTGGDYDTYNQFSNALLQFSFREQIKGLFGLEPQWHVEDNKIYLANFPDPDKVHIIATVKIPTNDDTYELQEEEAIRFIRKYALGVTYENEGMLRLNSSEVGFEGGLAGDKMMQKGEKIIEKLEDTYNEFNAPLFG